MATSQFAVILLSLRAQGLVEWTFLISRTLAIASKHFECKRDPLPAANAQRHHSPLQAIALHRMQ